MRFMGIIGILLFMAIAYAFSKDRKAINWQTIAWGLCLQVLFAITILGSVAMSFFSAGLLLLLMTVYLAKTRFAPWCQTDHPFMWVRTMPEWAIIVISILKMVLIAVVLGYFLGKSYEGIMTLTINIIWGVAILIWLMRKYIKTVAFHTVPINSALVIVALNISLGLSFAIVENTNGMQGTMAYHLQQLSLGVSDFLSIPTRAGSSFIFGPLADIKEPWYFLFFVQVLPTIMFFSAFISVLYYLGVVQVLIEEISQFMCWTMKTSGAETLSCAGNIFVGQTEAPILIKPFIKKMTNSEIHAVMTGGFATIAGGVFAGFVAMGIDAGHLISASVMSAPAALMLSKMFYPETEHSQTAGDVAMPKIEVADNIIGAAAQGTSDGLLLAMNVGAMLLTFIALIKVIDMGLGAISDTLSLNIIFGSVFQYVAYLIGVSGEDVKIVGSLLGNKITINEFVAVGNLAELMKTNAISPRSAVIATYALCGFANFSSIGIQIGGITPLAPERKKDIASLGFSAMWAGAFASWMTAAIAGMFIG